MTDNPYVNFYTSDFLAGTSGMTAASKGVYITLLCLMYEAEAPLTQSWDTLARRCGCTKAAFKKAVEALVDDEKITVTEAGIWSDKCEKHIALRRERANSAKAAAKKRWKKSEKKQGKGNAPASSAHCQPEPEPEPEKEEINSSFLSDANIDERSIRIGERFAARLEARRLDLEQDRRNVVPLPAGLELKRRSEGSGA